MSPISNWSRATSHLDVSSDLSKLHELWQRTKRELRARSEELSDLKASTARIQTDARLSKVHESESTRLSAESAELKDRLRFTEVQLSAARKENERWSRSFEDVNGQLQQQQLEWERQRSAMHVESSRTRDYECRLRELEGAKKDLVTKSIAELRDNEEEMQHSRHVPLQL